MKGAYVLMIALLLMPLVGGLNTTEEPVSDIVMDRLILRRIEMKMNSSLCEDSLDRYSAVSMQRIDEIMLGIEDDISNYLKSQKAVFFGGTLISTFVGAVCGGLVTYSLMRGGIHGRD